jgi:hypothetical protein
MMKPMRFALFLLAWIFLFPPLLLARTPSNIVGDTFEEISGRGLEIRTNPPGVSVFINGVERTPAPAVFENLPPGEHSIRLSKEGYRDRRFNVVLFNNSRLVVSIEMEEERGFALVSVHKAQDSNELLPFNPQIFTRELSDNFSVISLNDSNTMLINLRAGQHTIRARAFGWEDASVTVLVNEHITAAADIYMTPAQFRLDNAFQTRRRFNPKNAGTLGRTEYHFEVSAPGSGVITILDKNETVVYHRQLNNFDTWNQSIIWNGRDIQGNLLPEGKYTILIEAVPLPEISAGEDPPQIFALNLETEINYSINIFPLSLSGGISGLVFTPLPYVLPVRSFQSEGSILLGSFPQRNKPFSVLPFEIGFRFSPVNRLEISSVFNVNPLLNDVTGWGVTGGIKYNFLDGIGSVPLAFAAGTSYAWASNNGEVPLSSGRGIGLHTPLSLALSMFSVVFSPGLFWHGPETAEPALLLSAGLLYKVEWVNAGLSFRPEINFLTGSTRFFAGAEGRFYPPPSNLVFSFQAGMWTHDSNIGGYGGLGIGFIF